MLDREDLFEHGGDTHSSRPSTGTSGAETDRFNLKSV